MIYGFVTEYEDEPATVVVAANTVGDLRNFVEILKKDSLVQSHEESDAIMSLTLADFKPFRNALDIFVHKSEKDRDAFIAKYQITIQASNIVYSKVDSMKKATELEEEVARYHQAYDNPESYSAPTMAELAGIDISKIAPIEMQQMSMKNAADRIARDELTGESFASFDGNINLINQSTSDDPNDIFNGNFVGVKYDPSKDDSENTTAGDMFTEDDDEPTELPPSKFSPEAFKAAILNVTGEEPNSNEGNTENEKPVFSMDAFSKALAERTNATHSEPHPVLYVIPTKQYTAEEGTEVLNTEENVLLGDIYNDMIEEVEEYFGIENVDDAKISFMDIPYEKLVNNTFELSGVLGFEITDPDNNDEMDKHYETVVSGKYIFHCAVGSSSLEFKEASSVFHLDEKEEGDNVILLIRVNEEDSDPILTDILFVRVVNISND